MLLSAFAAVFQPMTFLLICGGVILGIIFGAIPGMSATMAVALCLPISFGLEPVAGISLLIGLYIGGISGGLISAILLKIPGTPSSVATTFDGGPMAEKGQAGKALGIGIVYSFIGGMISILILMVLAPQIAKIALQFGPYEYFSVTIFSLTMVAALSDGNLIKGILSALIGSALAMIGVAPIDSVKRFTFGSNMLNNGLALLSVMIGFYAISEVISEAGNKVKVSQNDVKSFKMKGFGFSMKEFGAESVNMVRSAAIGVGIGILPGIGGGTSNMIAYAVAKSQAKNKEEYGKGCMGGIVASETANNASIGGALIPLLTLGIPGDTVTAMLLGGLMIHGIQPGPLLFQNNGNMVYAIFAALIVANIAMLVMEFLGIRVFVRLLSIPKNILLPIIVCLCVVGAFAENNRLFDVYAMVGCGILAFVLQRLKFSIPPLILGFILAEYTETYLRRALSLSNGSITPFFTRPISLVFLMIAFVSITFSIYKSIKNAKK